MEPGSPGANPSPSILVVIVLYRTSLASSRTVGSLAAIFAAAPELLQELQILVWDNSQAPLSEQQAGFPFEYHHAERNEGVSGAYNSAAAAAEAGGVPWLLLLDQDTTVTGVYLRAIIAHARELSARMEIAAVVPWLFANQFQLSPRYVRFGRHTPVSAARRGLERREIFAANSGLLLRVAALREIEGYSPLFWLDYSDIYVFRRFFEQRKAVYLAPELKLQHEIAMLDYDVRMTPERYQNYLGAEGAFLDLYKGRLERAVHWLRLLVRAMRQRRLRDPQYALLTKRALRERLVQRRTSRIERWKAAAHS